MSFKLRSLAMLLAVAVLGGVVASQSSSSAQNPARGIQWAYRVDTASSIEQEVLNKAGERGWELVSVYEQDKGQFRAIYKKRTITD